MEWFKGLFSDTGNVSMTRFLSFICVLSAVIIALHAISTGSDLNAASVLCGTFLGAGLGSKVVQRFAERGE